MSNLSCVEVQDYVYDYLAKEVDQELRENINKHLKECGSCANEYALELKISSLISASSLNSVSTDELVTRAYLKLDDLED